MDQQQPIDAEFVNVDQTKRKEGKPKRRIPPLLIFTTAEELRKWKTTLIAMVERMLGSKNR